MKPSKIEIVENDGIKSAKNVSETFSSVPLSPKIAAEAEKIVLDRDLNSAKGGFTEKAIKRNSGPTQNYMRSSSHTKHFSQRSGQGASLMGQQGPMSYG